MFAKPGKRSAIRVLYLLAILLVACSAFLLLPAQHAKADDGGYPWAGAATVPGGYSEWGYTKCPDNSKNCMLLKGTGTDGNTYGEADPYGYVFRNCTSFVAWKLDTSNNWVNKGGSMGNAYQWGVTYKNITNTTPAIGSVAWWAANAPGASSYGHVAWVSDIDSNGGITIQQYNGQVDKNGNPTGVYSTAYYAKSSTKWPTGFIHFNDLSSSPTPIPSPTSNIHAIKSSLSPDGTIEVFMATASNVTLGWYRNGGDGPHTLPIINISQNDIVGIDKLNVDNTELVYVAVSDGVWEASRVNGSTVVQYSKPVTGLTGVRGVIAENTFEGAYRVHHLYILAADGPYEAYWKDSDPTHTVHVGRLIQINGGVTFTHSIAPNGAEQLYVAVPTWVYEVSWVPNGTVNSQMVINIPQGDIRSVEKGANLPDGGELLYTTTSTTVWQSYRNGTGAFNAPGTVATGQTNALQGLKSVTPDGWHRVFLALPDHVQEYKWLGSSSGGGEIIRLSQGNIAAIAQQLDGNNQLLFTAAGSYVWETWWNSSTGYNTAPSALFTVSA